MSNSSGFKSEAVAMLSRVTYSISAKLDVEALANPTSGISTVTIQSSPDLTTKALKEDFVIIATNPLLTLILIVS